MRIATWNIERGGRSRAASLAQERVLHALAADVVVLTEPPPSYRTAAGIITSPPLRKGPSGVESWVAILGASVEPVALDIPFERMAAAARATLDGRHVIIYGAVLPWGAIRTHATDLVHVGETALDVFVRVLEEQVADITMLRQRDQPDAIVWVGDFNQTVTGPNRSGSGAKRDALTRALAHLGFEAWNAEAAHATADLCAIDLICGPRDWRPARQGRIDPVLDDVVLSDHAGYWIELE
jgi:endonuclease/exonuclease/phosphatase family metal-dependent hydrolase